MIFFVIFSGVSKKKIIKQADFFLTDPLIAIKWIPGNAAGF
jgi:hypothetical protein